MTNNWTHVMTMAAGGKQRFARASCHAANQFLDQPAVSIASAGMGSAIKQNAEQLDCVT